MKLTAMLYPCAICAAEAPAVGAVTRNHSARVILTGTPGYMTKCRRCDDAAQAVVQRVAKDTAARVAALREQIAGATRDGDAARKAQADARARINAAIAEWRELDPISAPS